MSFVSDQFKVSNIPTLTGWNTSMSIMNMLDQLKTTYDKPNAMTLFANNTLFCSAFNPNDAPESLFHRIEQCQEIAILARDPYSDVQVINNAVRLLMQASIFPMKEFDDWEAVTLRHTPPSRHSLRQRTYAVFYRNSCVTRQDRWGMRRRHTICTLRSTTMMMQQQPLAAPPGP
jgi:hypothetical protein